MDRPRLDRHGSDRAGLDRWRVAVGAIAAGVLVWLLIGGRAGAVLAAVAVACAARWLARLEPAHVRRAHRQMTADVPFAADLMAAALRAGAPTEHAVRLVGEALAGPLGVRLVGVADALSLGLEPEHAWARARDSAGLARMADAVIRSADSGAAVSRALHRLADDLRAARSADVEAATQRVGVLIVLPLGLCFLPAFVFAGVAPVIVAVLGGVLR